MASPSECRVWSTPKATDYVTSKSDLERVVWRSTKRDTEHGACVYMLQVEKYHSVCILPGCGLELQQDSKRHFGRDTSGEEQDSG